MPSKNTKIHFNFRILLKICNDGGDVNDQSWNQFTNIAFSQNNEMLAAIDNRFSMKQKKKYVDECIEIDIKR